MSNNKDGPNSVHLDQIINCVIETNPRQSLNQTQSKSKLENLYGEAGQLIKNFETNINRCKRYNEAKINRKYEMIITDLENQVKKLTQKLKIEQDARSPTKKHVSDILDQLVTYKQENERLKKELAECRGMLGEFQQKCENQANAIKKMQVTQPKALIQRLPALNAGLGVAQSIKQYLKAKTNIRKVVANTQRSSLQLFLHQNQAKSWNWTIGNLLQQLDKWADGIKPNKQVDMWRIRSSVAKSFSQYLDDCQTLTRPASFSRNMVLSPVGTSAGTTLGLGGSTEKKEMNKKQSRFSMIGDRDRQRQRERDRRERSLIDSSSMH